ncbi:MAG: peptide ABC transporter substrate-binding protein [Anaerolineae bacterium]|nr:peptide ABC transporter substrate-binding protein [Anaerolineae bacterium]
MVKNKQLATTLVATGLVMVACASPTAAPKPAEPPKAPAPTRGSGGTLKMLYWQAPTLLNTTLSAGFNNYDAARLVLEPLAAINEKGEMTPVLAAELPTLANGGVAADYTSVTWKLKPNLKWNDGTAFTIDDVQFSLSYCRAPGSPCANATTLAGVKSIDKVSDTSFRINWDKPNADPYQSFTSIGAAILQKKQFEKCVGEAATKDTDCQRNNIFPIGTGPYKVKEMKPGDTVLYEMNEHYRDANKPFFKEVVIKGGGTAPSAAQAVLQSGEYDYATNLVIEGDLLNSYASSKTGQLKNLPTGTSDVIFINLTNPDPALGEDYSDISKPHPFLTDVKVRQAIQFAIDRKTIAERLYGIGGVPTCEYVVHLPYIAPDKIFGGRNNCAYDLEKSKKLLDEAGWKVGAGGTREKDGKKLKIVFQTAQNALREKAMSIIKDALQAVGFEVELKAVNPIPFLSFAAGNPDTAARFTADLTYTRFGISVYDATAFFCLYTKSGVPTKANKWVGFNYPRFSSDDYDKQCADTRAELNADKRREGVLKMNDTLVQNAIIIPVTRLTKVVAFKNELKGPVGSPLDSELWNIADWTR